MVKTERVVRGFAGLMVLLTLLFGVSQSPLYYSSYILWITVLVGVNLFQSAFTKFCLLEIILKKLGMSND